MASSSRWHEHESAIIAPFVFIAKGG